MAGRASSSWIAATAVLIAGAVVWDVARRALRSPPAPTVPPAGVVAAPRPTPAGRVSQSGSGPPPLADVGFTEQLARAEMRRRIRASAGIAYLDAFMATSGDSMLHRWDRRVIDAVRVFLGEGRPPTYRPEFGDAVRSAFARWEATGVPVRFTLLADSATAEVGINWRIQFEIDRTAQTDLTWDAGGHLESGAVTFALFDPQGRPMEADDIRVVALHEIGHLLGLDHSPDSTDLMFPVAKVRDLSDRDIQSALLLYDLPPGSIR
jgi:hypothetical protein